MGRNTTTLKDAFLSKYPKYPVILRMFEDATGEECTWENLSKLSLTKFVDYLVSQVAVNSARQYAAKFKAVLNLYSEEENLPKDFAAILSLKKEDTANTWLNENDLIKLEHYTAFNPIEKIVLNQFLIGAYTGCRHSDYAKLDETNISSGLIVYVSQKTKTLATVPLKPIVLKLLAERPNEQITEVTFNKYIREICRKAGINDQVKVYKGGKACTDEKWKFITSHTARRSFATNLYLRGCDLYSISRMMGHASVTQTETYICCGLKNLSERVMEYFR